MKKFFTSFVVILASAFGCYFLMGVLIGEGKALDFVKESAAPEVKSILSSIVALLSELFRRMLLGLFSNSASVSSKDSNPVIVKSDNSRLIEQNQSLMQLKSNPSKRFSRMNGTYGVSTAPEMMIRLQMFCGFLMAFLSCLATFVYPPVTDQARMHTVAVVAAYCAPALLLGIFSHLAVDCTFARAFFAGLLTAFFLNSVTLLITVGYSHSRWFNDEISIFASQMSLAAIIGLIRLVVIPLCAGIFCFIGLTVSHWLFPNAAQRLSISKLEVRT